MTAPNQTYPHVEVAFVPDGDDATPAFQAAINAGQSVIHLCPPGDSNIMPCCGKTPWEALSDRMTLDPQLVTCHGASEV